MMVTREARRILRLRNWAAPIALLIATVLCGCGSGPDPYEKTPEGERAKVSGSVTFDGKPVPLDSNVIFYNKEKAATAAGKVDTLGNYTLSPAVEKVGIPVGRYQVMIAPPRPEAAAVGSPDYAKAMMQGAQKVISPKEIPEKFHAFETSGIVLEIKAGDNKFDFDLAKLSK